ncbi:LytTR family DNA-binding domain-containing protein [Aurantiacibacter rhizosphaerae]|nr:LytTR family DNA-binding domain-containing protein [Aurantiacibacter rhizosphaerae]
MDTSSPRNGARLIRQIIIDIAVLLGIGAVLGVLAPLGTGYMSLAARMAYWMVLAVAGYAFYKPIGAIVLQLGPKLDLPNWFLWAASVVIASVPMAILVWFVNEGRGPVRIPSLEVALVHYFFVLVVGAVITIMFNLLPITRAMGAHAQPAAQAPAASPPPPAIETPAQPAGPRFLERLPAEIGTDLIALEMEDHYVRAHTALGSELVLMRMRDAVAELDGIAGEQVHRSWWVARGAVADVKRDGRNVRLVLDNGVEAPVSRANVSVLKDRGWI